MHEPAIPHLTATDPVIAGLVQAEAERQHDKIRLIASENYVSSAVMEATGTVLTNKYSEGYAGKRYYEGQQVVDPVEIQLESGVAVVVGPNGSGKSNVSDSILWATGSLSPCELRAQKPDAVLFAGSAGPQPNDFCEVHLLFDHSDDAWPDLPYSEVSVSRRLTRGGEGQYLVNRTPVRRIDLVELLSDVGLGGGLRSVISQGRVETVLNSKPAERRELIEEAAGLGRFKRRRHRAELKLARVLARLGVQVVDTPGQTCCGSLHAHAGDNAEAVRLAKPNIAASITASMASQNQRDRARRFATATKIKSSATIPM